MFLDKDFLLNTETARKLYHEAAESCPIIDYHCHISPREIWEDLRYENITQVWLGGDHYKWRLMRSAGVPEKYITGKETSDHDKFLRWAEVLGKAIGNPLYHWSHLELRRYFGYEGVLNRDTAEAVWTLCNEQLARPEFSVRNLIRLPGGRRFYNFRRRNDFFGGNDLHGSNISKAVRNLRAQAQCLGGICEAWNLQSRIYLLKCLFYIAS